MPIGLLGMVGICFSVTSKPCIVTYRLQRLVFIYLYRSWKARGMHSLKLLNNHRRIWTVCKAKGGKNLIRLKVNWSLHYLSNLAVEELQGMRSLLSKKTEEQHALQSRLENLQREAKSSSRIFEESVRAPNTELTQKSKELSWYDTFMASLAWHQ